MQLHDSVRGFRPNLNQNRIYLETQLVRKLLESVFWNLLCDFSSSIMLQCVCSTLFNLL